MHVSDCDFIVAQFLAFSYTFKVQELIILLSHLSFSLSRILLNVHAVETTMVCFILRLLV